jgi:hypothetical protein
LQVIQLFSQVVFLCPTALPAVAPIQNKELEAESVNLDGRLEADAQIIVVHLVELGAGVQQADVAGNGEEEVIVEWRELGELVLEHLWCGFCALTFSLDLGLNFLGEYFVG